jgi:uncharacterized protein YbjT (DUF2867 family)
MILVTGPTGNVGRELVKLLDSGEEVGAVTRDPGSAAVPAGARVVGAADPPGRGRAAPHMPGTVMCSPLGPRSNAEAGIATRGTASSFHAPMSPTTCCAHFSTATIKQTIGIAN